MKIKLDEELSVLHKYTFGIAKEIGETMGQNMINLFLEKLNDDDKFGELDYSGAISTILKANNIAFIRVFQFICYIGSKFPDIEHNSHELFEEAIKGLRFITRYKEPDEKEYTGGIKKIISK